MTDYRVCRCMHVYLSDIENVLRECGPFDDSRQAFQAVFERTRITGSCGACLHKVMDLLEELLKDPQFSSSRNA